VSVVLPIPLVSTSWLDDHLGDDELVVIDGSWYLAAMGRDPKAEFPAGHIPGAVFWDLDALSDQQSTLPHMLPDAGTFERQVRALGIGSHHAIVAYDGSGTNLSAARVWWMFRVFGHERIAVLDGGFQKWRAEGRRVERTVENRQLGVFNASWRPDLVRSLQDVARLIGSAEAQLLDARSVGRFEGREPEPRPGVRSGHIPGAKNLPFTELSAADGTLLPPDQLERRFRDAGIDLARPVVLSCGSGVSACALALGLAVLGHRNYAVYDGSWTEWGGSRDTPVETGRS